MAVIHNSLTKSRRKPRDELNRTITILSQYSHSRRLRGCAVASLSAGWGMRVAVRRALVAPGAVGSQKVKDDKSIHEKEVLLYARPSRAASFDSCTRMTRHPRPPGAYTCSCLCQQAGCVQL
jgi:hypothetical protein